MREPTPSTPFRVPVRELPTHRRVEVGSDYVAGVLRGLPMRDALGDAAAGEGIVDVELYGEGEHVHAAGTIRGHVVVACSRCVGPARIDLDERVHVTYLLPTEIAGRAPADGAGDGAPEVELGAEDLDVLPYDGEHVDLEPLLRDHLVLAVPYAPLCREACLGLCPQCGVDRNVEACACEKPGDPRFAALRDLKLPT
jgi:uncharacterized protein